ncbi:transcriptional repressor MprA [compost metagenome]
MLNQLESEGYVIRVRSMDDRRIVWLSLSEEGKCLAEKIINFRNQYAADLLGVLTNDERADFISILKKIEHRIEERMKEDS